LLKCVKSSNEVEAVVEEDEEDKNVLAHFNFISNQIKITDTLHGDIRT
jgi:hypothetical protein